MSHFTTIKTKIKEKPILLEALNLLQYNVNEKQDLVIENPDHAEDHPTIEVDISIGVDIGFKLNEKTGSFEFYSDHATWEKDIPVERFLEKLTQQYARMMIHRTIKEEGFEVQEECEMDDNSIELTVNRWVN